MCFLDRPRWKKKNCLRLLWFERYIEKTDKIWPLLRYLYTKKALFCLFFRCSVRTRSNLGVLLSDNFLLSPMAIWKTHYLQIRWHFFFHLPETPFFGLWVLRGGPSRKTDLLTWPRTTAGSWRSIFWENVHPLGANFPQNMGLQLPPVASNHFDMYISKNRVSNKDIYKGKMSIDIRRSFHPEGVRGSYLVES